MQFGETFPSLLQLEAPSKTFTELLLSVVGLLVQTTLQSLKVIMTRLILILHMQYTK
jgi:hypothetical protein